MKHLIFILCFCVMLVGCGARKPATPSIHETEKITVIERDTVFKTEKDSSFYHALLECQNGKVVIVDKTVGSGHALNVPTVTKGKHLNPPKVVIKDNQLQVDCTAEAQELLAKWKETHKEKVIVKTEIKEVERKRSWWESIMYNLGFAFFLVAILFVIHRLSKLN